MLPIISHLHVPEQSACETVERNQMGVIGHHKHFVAEDCHASINRSRRIADQTFSQWALIAPDLPAVSRVQGIRAVSSRHIHHAVHDYWSHFQPARIWD